MPTDRYELTVLQTVVTVETGPARSPVVALEYEGVEPPLDLLACLRLIGFEGLTPQPPPSSAIVWGGSSATSPAPTVPTILPFRATARAELVGSARAADRAVDAARLVLERLAPADAPREADGEERAPAPVVRSRLAASVLASTRERVATLTERSPGSSRTEPVDPVDGTPPQGDGAEWDIQVVVDPDDAEDVRAVLGAHGSVLEETPVTWTSEVAYRGQRSETHHRAVRLLALIDERSRDPLLAALSRRRLRSVELRA